VDFPFAATLAIWAIFAYTKLGLVVRAVGENPKAAHAIGYSVIRPCRAIAFGGAMAGFAGAYAAVVYTPLWADGMIAGRGWIAIALVVFGTWLTGRIFLGACLFGAVSLMGLAAQATGMDVPSQLLSSLPYLVTIIVLGIISADRRLLETERRRFANGRTIRHPHNQFDSADDPCRNRYTQSLDFRNNGGVGGIVGHFNP
jgi:ABC-type uncharacterized transport system permease subunit